MDDCVLEQTEAVECILVPHSKSVNSLEDDVRNGLLNVPRSLPPKYFYDETGSKLFDQICNTPEYYPTRVESALLRKHAIELIEKAQPDHIIEFGSGTSRKTRFLLEACEELGTECQYLPFDVCKEMLCQVKEDFNRDYTWLDVLPLVGDFTAGLEHLHQPEGSCMYAFLGSSIGNFSPEEAEMFVAEVRNRMQPGDSLLLGVDRIKNHDVLHAAYNDAEGVTEKFNLNVLNVLNANLKGNFNKNNFRHEAVYNKDKQRIEMYLVSEEKQTVHLQSINEKIFLQKGERILTEISQKYSHNGVENLLTRSDLNILRHVEPDDAYYSLVLANI